MKLVVAMFVMLFATVAFADTQAVTQPTTQREAAVAPAQTQVEAGKVVAPKKAKAKKHKKHVKPAPAPTASPAAPAAKK
jgi:hypothetical protein